MPALPKNPPADTYRVEREPEEGGSVRCYAVRDGRARKLRHVKAHSTGLETGYSGSGPADLALTILADLFRTSRDARSYRRPKGLAAEVWCLHQMFKGRWIAGLEVKPGDRRELDARELYAWALTERSRLRAGLAQQQEAAR